MAEPDGVVALESLSDNGKRKDVDAVDGRIAEKWFVRERKWVSKTFGKNEGRKVNILFWFRSRLHPWKCSCRFEDGQSWRWIAGRFGREESFKGANGSGDRSAGIVEGTGWGRVLDLMDEILDEQ